MLKPAKPENPLVTRGQDAWTTIKAERRVSRALWRDVGAALRAVREKSPDDATFAGWCYRNGFRDMRPAMREDAMQFSAAWGSKSARSATIPPTIREWYRDRLRRARRRKVIHAEVDEIPVQSVKPSGLPTEAKSSPVEPPCPDPTEGNREIAAMLLEAVVGLQRSEMLLVQVALALQKLS